MAEHEEPDHYVDVSDYMETAVQALKQHQTQVSEVDADTHMRQWRTRTGEKAGFQYAEAFRRFHLG